MADPDPADARDRLVAALRGALAASGAADRDAARFAHLLVARERFAAAVGEPPGGALATLAERFDGVPRSEAAADALAAVRSSLGDVTTGDIGGGYAATLPAGGRGERGQFFTPAPVAAALVRWALGGTGPAGSPPSCSDSAPPRVLDPAVGTGTFPLAALRWLRAARPDAGPAALLGRLVGVDVDPPAVHLAGLRLAAAAGVPSPDSLPLHPVSFFDCEPAGDALDAGSAGSAAGSDPAVVVEPVDAVVGNPPFVRAEDLRPGPEHFRRHLAAFGPDGEAPWLDGADALSRRCDAYVYFVTHATRFLRPGGRLALVLPTKWLMSDYGEGLRRFLRERYRVRAVVGFGARAFGDALVDTALLCAERDDAAGRDEPLRFVRLDEASTVDDLLAAVAAAPSAGSAAESSPTVEGSSAGPAAAADAGTVERPQASLTAPGSLARYLEAPAELLSLLDGPAFVRLDELAEVSRGTMTGANRFFFVDGATVDRFGIEPRFLSPAVKSLRWVERPVVGPDDVERQVVDVHGYVADRRATLDGGAPTSAAVAESLASDGHDGLHSYVEHAEREGWHRGRTCQSRPVWFDLGELPTPAAFVPKLLRERVFVVRNAARAVPSNAIDGLWPRDGIDAGALLGALNSSAGRAAMEVTGRDEAGLLQLMTYETASLPTLDVRTLSRADRRAVARAGEAFARDPGPGTVAALDEAVAAAFDLPVPAGTLREHATALRRRRVDGGETVSVPLD